MHCIMKFRMSEGKDIFITSGVAKEGGGGGKVSPSLKNLERGKYFEVKKCL